MGQREADNDRRVRITDVAPRDGLQNEAEPIPTEDKAALVRALARTGVDEVEVTSFVSPKWIPQLGDASLLCEMISAHKPRVLYSALAPNEKGIQRLLVANEQAEVDVAEPRLIDKVSVFTAASETFSEKNTNGSIDETLERFWPVVELAHAAGLLTRGYISCAFACPFEGAIAPEVVGGIAKRLVDMGIDEIDLGDTIGKATPDSTRAVVEAVGGELGAALMGRNHFTLHLHDTFGTAGGCVDAALEAGVRSFDASAGGLGGCPYAANGGKRAPGNISTAALLDRIEAAGFTHGVDREALDRAAALAIELTRGAGA